MTLRIETGETQEIDDTIEITEIEETMTISITLEIIILQEQIMTDSEITEMTTENLVEMTDDLLKVLKMNDAGQLIDHNKWREQHGITPISMASILLQNQPFKRPNRIRIKFPQTAF